jgi:hypothetical protein
MSGWENIHAWLALVKAGDHERAWRQLVSDNPLAAIHGRVCYHPCESVCNRAQLDDAVSIHSVERFLGLLISRPAIWDVRGHARAKGPYRAPYAACSDTRCAAV